ncbi:DNA-binding transcriptional regulator YhcF, GntR family [Clostridium cavendishii DSM 21758]|uniref:DNA-binding transcriptional regulator YhcF, GntR family n=1 Tax=Clostridium cavendishii DSM 21758 TaxID=1121302 RepID=A0A1M6CXZ7_9CLOT|nr:GntR family transcriptional regulator [Clostridium cavendishii]SHI65902.1 DNA-binding transcriptional regulator YhcF, GntR family [Clostridium cavendishii DSM 21758]
MSVVFNEKLPIYIQIINYIKQRIISKEIALGEKLPSVRDLSNELKVNPNTIQKVYAELERQGITYSKRGMGTFIVEDETLISSLKNELALDSMNDFVISMKSLGFTKEEVKAFFDKKWDDFN